MSFEPHFQIANSPKKDSPPEFDMALVPVLPDAIPADAEKTTFTSLPTEIQIQIYKEFFSKIEVQHTVYSPFRNTRVRHGYPDGRDRKRFTPRYPLAILRVSKQISFDARPYATNCPIFLEIDYQGVWFAQVDPSLPRHACHRVCSLIVKGNAPISVAYTIFNVNELQRSEYPNLRYIEFDAPAQFLYLSDNRIRTLLDGTVSEFVMSHHSALLFEIQFSPGLGTMIRANDATVKVRVWLVRGQGQAMGNYVLNSSDERLVATLVWNRQGMRVSDVMPDKSTSTMAVKSARWPTTDLADRSAREE